MSTKRQIDVRSETVFLNQLQKEIPGSIIFGLEAGMTMDEVTLYKIYERIKERKNELRQHKPN